MVNCNENAYIANYRKIGKPIEYKRNINERVKISTFPPIVSHEIGNEEELPIQSISSTRSLKKLIKPTHEVVKKKRKRRKNIGKKVPLQIMLLLLLLCLMKMNQK